MVGGFAGYIVGWFLVPDWSGIEGWRHLGHAYGYPFAGLALSLLLYVVLRARSGAPTARTRAFALLLRRRRGVLLVPASRPLRLWPLSGRRDARGPACDAAHVVSLGLSPRDHGLLRLVVPEAAPREPGLGQAPALRR